MLRNKDARLTIRTDSQTKREIQIKAKSVGWSMNKYMIWAAIKGLREDLNRR